MARLQRSRAVLERNDGHPMLREISDRHRRLEGLVYWRQMKAFPDRLREAEKASRLTARLLSESAMRRASLEGSLAEGVERLAPLARRIDQSAVRADALQSRTRQLIAAQRDELESLALAELARRQNRVSAYLDQARYALAASYDRAARVAPEEVSP
jgi:hypothetical protein